MARRRQPASDCRGPNTTSIAAPAGMRAPKGNVPVIGPRASVPQVSARRAEIVPVGTATRLRVAHAPIKQCPSMVLPRSKALPLPRPPRVLVPSLGSGRSRRSANACLAPRASSAATTVPRVRPVPIVAPAPPAVIAAPVRRATTVARHAALVPIAARDRNRPSCSAPVPRRRAPSRSSRG